MPYAFLDVFLKESSFFKYNLSDRYKTTFAIWLIEFNINAIDEDKLSFLERKYKGEFNIDNIFLKYFILYHISLLYEKENFEVLHPTVQNRNF